MDYADGVVNKMAIGKDKSTNSEETSDSVCLVKDEHFQAKVKITFSQKYYTLKILIENGSQTNKKKKQQQSAIIGL